jgi:deoxyribonuclease V
VANWPVSDGRVDPRQAIAIQKEMAGKIVQIGTVSDIFYIAGVDVSFPRGSDVGIAAAVVLNYPNMEVVEVRRYSDQVAFPYVPGLLSFRELPLILKAFQALRIKPDLVIVDGHGVAHPRRMGLACHFGLYSNLPVIGCAKSRLCGKYREPDKIKGSREGLVDGEEVIGAVLRTREDVSTVFVSVGNHISLENAVKWVMSTCLKHRLPEPVRCAHMAATGWPECQA